MVNSVTIKGLLRAASLRFSQISDTPQLDAELLLCQVLDCNKTYLFTWPENPLSEAQQSTFEVFCQRRDKGEPIAHILGVREFWSLSLEVNASTLIPRPDTETLVEQALAIAMEISAQTSESVPLKGLDLGTGTGAIALALASELNDWQWCGVDFSHDAVALATRNGHRNQVANCRFEQSDWYHSVKDEKFDLIVSNPPYIDALDPHLKEGDVRFEPLSALVAEEQGLADIRHILKLGRDHLTAQGALLLEHGYQQGQAVRQLFQDYGYHRVTTVKDLSGNDRVSIGYLR